MLHQGRWNIVLIEGAGDEWEDVEVGIRDGAPYNFYNNALRLQEDPFLNIKMHPILDKTGYLLYEVIH